MKNFVAIDFETANYEPTSICFVGLVVVRGGEITQRMHRLVCPEPDYYIRRFSEQVHGIYPADTCGAPTFDAVWSEIVPWVEGLPFVAHNKAFDERVLRAACRMYGIDYTYGTFLCTLRQARRVIPARPLPITGYPRFVPIWVFPSTAITMHLPMPKAVRALPSVCGETKNKKRSLCRF